MNKVIVSFSVFGLMACSDLFLGGVSNGDPLDPEIKEVKKTDTLFVPKDSIVIPISHSINDTLFDLEYVLEANRRLKLYFEVESNTEITNSTLVGRVVSAAALKLNYNNTEFSTFKNEKTGGFWSHDFENDVQFDSLVELDLKSLATERYAINLLTILGYEADSMVIPNVLNKKGEEYQSLSIKKKIDSESFTWDEFNAYEGDSIKVMPKSNSKINSYLISETEFGSFLKTGIIPADYLARFDSLSIDTTLAIDTNVSLVYLVENNTEDILDINDSIKIFKSVNLN